MMENSLHILLSYHEGDTHVTLTNYLRVLGHQVEVAHDGHTALQKISAQRYDLALVDFRMPDINGIEFSAKVQQNQQETPVVLISGDDTVRTVMEAFRLDMGAFLPQSIQTPNSNAEQEKGRRMDNLRTSHHNPRRQNQFLVGNSLATQRVRERIRQVVEANVETILITGETGTGKEVVAQEIHSQASTEECPFVAVNCSAFPESLADSELFGHVKGAFTDATADKPGYFELANNGTLFLDEIVELPLHTQAKLLRVLDTRTLRRVGDTQEISVQERVISASNKDLAQIVESGQFRDDLFHRLNVFCIHLKPLQERIEDILPLANHFLGIYTARTGRSCDGFSEGAKSVLLDYQYPGNVRELRNIVERTVILCPPNVSLIGVQHLDIQGEASEKLPTQSNQSTDENEYERIAQALKETRWNRTQAAKNLGIPYSTFRSRIKKLKVQ